MDDQHPAGGPSGLRHTGQESHFLRELMRTSQAVLNVFSREVGMAGSRLALLRLLAVNHPQALGTMELARRLGVNAAAVTRQLKAMEAEALVVRLPDPRDARRSHATLTERGVATFFALHVRGHAFEERLTTAVSAADLETTTRVLGQVRAVLEELT